MIKILTNFKIILAFGFFVILIPLFTFAQSDAPYRVLAPLPCIESPDKTYTDSQGKTQTIPGIKCPNGNGSLNEEVDFKTYVQYTFNLLIALSAVLAVIMIIWGAIEYMLSGSIQVKSDGRKRIQNALFGLLLILTSYIILRTVDPRLVEIPNTLVPKLEIVDWLAQDSVSFLMNQLEEEVNRYRIKGIAIKEDLENLAKQKSQKLAELSNIEIEKGKLHTEDPDAPNKIKQLELQKEKIIEEIRLLDVDFQKKLTESAINSTVTSSALDAKETNVLAPDTDAVIRNRIENANNAKKEIESSGDIGKDMLKQKGEYNTKHVQEQEILGKTLIDLGTINLILNSASVVMSGGGYMGAGAVPKIRIIMPDGKAMEFTKPSDVKALIQKEIDAAKTIPPTLSQQKDKDLLNKKIEELEENLSSNKILN